MMSEFNQAVFPDLANAVLQTIAYADVFDFPLTAMEIHRYLTGIRAPRNVVELVLQERSLIHVCDGYYTLPNREGLAAVRRRREQIAGRMWPQATRYGRWIAGLPFVRMVAVTGSLAMNNVDLNPDIDYLIVTASGRLWMVRAMALAVARLAALQGVRLCPNYLVTEDALVFPNQTLYAAHELAQMVPVFGLDVYARICRMNPWKERFLPNAQGLPSPVNPVRIHPLTRAIKSLFERALRTPPGDWLENWEMQRKIRKLSREQSESQESCFAADYCKGHNLQHGKRTDRVFSELLERLRLENPE
jgi:hypothetical protein